MKIIYLLFVTVVILSAQAKAENLPKYNRTAIKTDCISYAEVLAAQKWLLLVGKKSLEDIDPQKKPYSFFLANEQRKCEVVKNIQILLGLKKNISADQWANSAGPKTLHNLNDQLVKALLAEKAIGLAAEQ